MVDQAVFLLTKFYRIDKQNTVVKAELSMQEQLRQKHKTSLEGFRNFTLDPQWQASLDHDKHRFLRQTLDHQTQANLRKLKAEQSFNR